MLQLQAFNVRRTFKKNVKKLCYLSKKQRRKNVPVFPMLQTLLPFLHLPISNPLNHEVATVCEIEKPLLWYWSAAAMMTIGKADPSEVVIERKELFNRSLSYWIWERPTNNTARRDFLNCYNSFSENISNPVVIYHQRRRCRIMLQINITHLRMWKLICPLMF